MPRLVQINATCNWGSTGRIMEQISILAEEKGWDCYIAHGGRYIRPSTQKTIQISSKLDNLFHAIKGEYLGLHGLGSILATKAFIHEIEKIKPDIIHLHNIHGYYINYKILFDYLSKANIPVVWTLHDCWSMTGHCTHFDAVGCDKWRIECHDCPLLMAQYKSRLFDRSRSNYQKKKEYFTSLDNMTIVPVSKWLEEIVKQSYLSKYRVFVINNGIDLNIFKPVLGDLRKQLKIGKDKIILLGVASDWGKEKGWDEFIRLSQNPAFQVIMIGLTTGQIKVLPDSIVKKQHTSSQQELLEYYTMADMLINPTYNDSFPTVNIEAQACGTPVVTYRTGGSPEILDNTTGIVVEKGDFEALMNAISIIKKNDKKYYSENCISRVNRLYNKDDKYNEYIKLYNEILDTK